jgi:hypothetical protein
VPVDFKQGGDTGEDNVNSIQPISNGEPVNQVTLRRPDENLRKRTEVLKASVLGLDQGYREQTGSYITTLGGTCYLEEQSQVVDGAIPAISSAWKFSPNEDTALVIASAAIAGGKVVIRASDFNTFYTNADKKDNHLIKKGDTIALKVPLTGEDSRTEFSWGNDYDFPYISIGNLSAEAQLVKVPLRSVLRDGSVTLLTDLGPDGLDLVTSEGVPVDDDTLYIAINSVFSEALDSWFAKGGRGSTSGADIDYLEVSRVGETFVEVVGNTPFRILWENSLDPALSWTLYTKSGAVYTSVRSGSSGYITEKDYSGYNIVPIVTYDGDGFVFHHGGGYKPKDSGSLLSFNLPSSPLSELASTEVVSEGAGLVGSKLRSSSGDVASNAEIDNYGGVNLASGTLSSQLDRLVKQAARRTRCLSRRVAYSSLSSGLVQSFLLDYDGHAKLSTKDRVTKIRFVIEESFALNSVLKTLTLDLAIGGTYLLSDFVLRDKFNKPLAGAYEIPVSEDVYSLSPPDLGTSGSEVTATFTCSSTMSGGTVTAGGIQIYVEVREIP